MFLWRSLKCGLFYKGDPIVNFCYVKIFLPKKLLID